MKNITLPCFYYPTTVTVVDDNQIFLENLVFNLNNEISYQSFENPFAAVEFIKSQQNMTPTLKDYLQASSDEFEESQFGQSLVSVNYADIRNKLNDVTRFSLSSVVVVDHDMPGMNGIDFCMQLRESPIKKIMLTGVADLNIAVKAFNDGIIHKFIMKSDPHVFASLDNAISELQHEYFLDLSELIIKNMTASSFSYLENQKFMQFFFDIKQKHNIIELYLIDPVGSFLMVTKNRELLYLVVKSAQDMTNDYQIALDQSASSDVLTALRNKTKLLFLFSPDDYKQTVDKWPNYLHETKRLEDIPDLYYALISAK